MKKHFIPCVCVCVATLLTSCQKQEIAIEPDIPRQGTIKFTPDELLRLTAMSSNRNRSQGNIISAVQNFLVTTKAPTGFFAITDSINSGVYTKSTNPLKVYIVSDNANKRFALVNSDITLNPLLGFFDGEYDKDNLNPGFEIMLEYTIAQMEYERDSIMSLTDDEISIALMRKLNTGQTKIDGDLWDPDDPNAPGPPQIPTWDRNETILESEWWENVYHIQPMLKVAWGQGTPFNNWDQDKNAAGCMAISAAQIMSYWKKPSNSPVDGQAYDWDKMITNLYGAAGSQSASRLSHDLGGEGYLHLSYNKNSSYGVDDVFHVPNGCANTARTFEKFGYHGGSHSSYLWSTLNSALGQGPVHICGDNGSKSAHTWVTDGMLETRLMRKEYIKFYYQGSLVYTLYLEPSSWQSGYMHHHNFGWNGRNDGWFYTGASLPESCNNNIKIIYGIRPK